jgi:putative hydrolase of the HAD superfamily
MVILFDLDDTLVTHSRAFDAATAALHARANVPLTLPEFASVWSAAHRRHFDRYLAGTTSYEGQRRARVREVIGSELSDSDADGLFATYLSTYEDSWALFADVHPCLASVSRYRLGVVSNGQSHQQRLKLQRLDIADRFDCILISEECGRSKPEPEIFLQACSLLGASPADAIYVGDQYDLDAVAARDAGLFGVWLDRGGAACPPNRQPAISSLDRLPQLVTALEG